MAAINPPKKSTKIVWRTCISCTTRLSELCYDTHTLCEACRGKVCNSTSFCKECENWTDEFRKLYLRHKRSLLLKRVSKKDKKEGRAKAKSPLQVDTAPPQVDDAPHQVDDAASSASQESHVSPPVVILPLNQELMDANIGLEELQQFQHVDNVVELQLQPVSPAPPSTTVSVDTSFFDKVNTMMENFNKIMPFLSQLGSDRRSPTAGPSDIVSPNPIARVPGTAPQGPDAAPQSPDVAPGPSSASLEPRASCSGLHHRDDKISNPRGRKDKGDQPSGSRHASQPPSPSHQERLRDQLEDVHRQLSHTREIVDFYRAHGRVPPDQSQDDLENLQAQYAQISIALEESVYVASSQRRGPSPASPFHRVASPAGAAPLGPHSSSSLHGSRRSDRPRSPSHDRSRSRDAFSGHPRPSRRSHERFEERDVPSDAPAHRRRPRDRESPSRRHLDFPSKSPSPRQKRFASQGSHSSSRERFASRGSSSPKRRRVAPDAPFQERFASRRSPSSPQERFASRRSPASSQERFASRRSPSSPQRRFASKGSSSPKRMGFAPEAGPSSSRRPLSRESRSPRPHSSRDTSSPKRGSPSPKRRRYESRDSVSPHHHHSSRASSREPSQGRPHSRSSPNHPSSPSREEKEADETSVPPTVKAMVNFIMKCFPEATASPAHPSSRSFDLSASVGATDVATPSGSLLAWCQVMADSFTATQKRFSQRIQEGRACHTLLPSLHRFERVSNSPTQGKELTANPDILDLLRNKVPDFRQLPISIKEGISIERCLRSMMETHSFLTWSVMGLIKSLYEKKLLPKDDPVISQLQKSFSKACSSMASGLASSTAFVTMKRRQLLLSHVVPSVSEAQKRNLLSDPFFQTGSLFDASSVESARSAARDLSLFKPHLKASSSSSQSRRRRPSGSSAQRGSARQSSRPSSSQRSSSPFRQQSGRKGDARFHKKSSGTPQKRGGFRK